jgi:hypothetical protein
MTSSEQFCLKWNEFQNNIVGSFRSLRKDADFSDVTLVCEEDQQIEAHRNILAASSPFFNTVLKRNKHSHPLIYMRGVKAKDLVAIMDFLYLGEANVYNTDLESFLALAEDLELEGLAGSRNDKDNTDQIMEKPERERKPNVFSKPKEAKCPERAIDEYNTESLTDNMIAPGKGGNMLVPVSSTMTKDIKEQIDSMVEKVGDKEYKCSVCGKVMHGSIQNINRHVETHLNGVSHPCNQCDKVARSSNGLHVHVSKYHRT